MDRTAIDEAATLLASAWSGACLEGLPPSLQPTTVDDTYEIQLAVTRRLGDVVAGWKIGSLSGFGTTVACILASRVFHDGAAIRASAGAMRGVEGEIAFRFERALPSRAEPYDRDEVASAVTAFPAIEIVDSRFCRPAETPPIVKAADFMSNGAFVAGPPQADWGRLNLGRLEATLTIDGVEVVREAGDDTSDPLGRAVNLVNALRTKGGVGAGQFVTTGTCTGLVKAGPGSSVHVAFGGFGSVRFQFAS